MQGLSHGEGLKGCDRVVMTRKAALCDAVTPEAATVEFASKAKANTAAWEFEAAHVDAEGEVATDGGGLGAATDRTAADRRLAFIFLGVVRATREVRESKGDLRLCIGILIA